MSARTKAALVALERAAEHVAGDPGATLVLLDAKAQVLGFPSYAEMIR